MVLIDRTANGSILGRIFFCVDFGTVGTCVGQVGFRGGPGAVLALKHGRNVPHSGQKLLL